MKRVLSLFLVVILMFCVFPLASQALSESDISATSAILMVAETGEILWQKNANNQMPMASTTKIMTSLLTIEQGTPNRVIKITEDMVKVEGSSMGLLPDDTITMQGLVYGMLLESGNDAANVAAISISGDVDSFVNLMNNKAKQIGMKNTNFVTPSGLDSDSHYSTAYDMALLGSFAIKNPEFLAVCSLKSIRISYGNPPYNRTLSNHNRLLQSYDGAIGIKTGFTKKSGRCLVSAACRNGVTLVAVTLKAPNDWADHTKLFNYGLSVTKMQNLNSDFSNLSLPIVGGEKNLVSVSTASVPQISASNTIENVLCKVYLKHFEYAPIEAGTVVGSAQYYADDKLICEVPLVASESINAKQTAIEEPTEKGFFGKIKDFLLGD